MRHIKHPSLEHVQRLRYNVNLFVATHVKAYKSFSQVSCSKLSPDWVLEKYNLFHKL